MLLVVLVKKKKEKENHFRRGHFESDASNTFQQRWERAVYPKWTAGFLFLYSAVQKSRFTPHFFILPKEPDFLVTFSPEQ